MSRMMLDREAMYTKEKRRKMLKAIYGTVIGTAILWTMIGAYRTDRTTATVQAKTPVERVELAPEDANAAWVRATDHSYIKPSLERWMEVACSYHRNNDPGDQFRIRIYDPRVVAYSVEEGRGKTILDLDVDGKPVKSRRIRCG